MRPRQKPQTIVLTLLSYASLRYTRAHHHRLTGSVVGKDREELIEELRRFVVVEGKEEGDDEEDKGGEEKGEEEKGEGKE